MTVTRIAEDIRVTRPYTPEQWSSIERAGQAVDEQLTRDDVRLTMGGEPTFVSIDDARSPQWNTEAVGEDKARLAARLAMRLRDRYAPEGSLQFGQGKWYPGEPLPRWSYALVWREDGVPLWREAKLIAETPSKSLDGAGARRVIDGIATQLGVDVDHVIPAFEDRRLRGTAGSEDKEYDKPVGFILPVQPWQARDRRRGWSSTRWTFPTSRLLLIPGDSPVGLRLPLESLEPVPDADKNEVVAQVPFDRAAPLPDAEQLQVTRTQRGEAAQTTTDMSVRTALAVETREGFVHVFLPPLPSAEDYVELLAAVEATARELDQPLRLEGYEPPPDHRLKTVRVTPDPGVIEVNVAPSSSWKELVDSTTSLYEESRLCRLGTEKFMLDGRHSGTGGGNHVVLGGATPADSPFLRRPDLLKSFLGYFTNHPSLSFLFSGMFVGPTSQAPRVDQARDDALYELEVAFGQLPDRDGADLSARPWVVDRIFRDVLVDVTGNTHRTEICIDKLYSPDSATGRLGLVEFRSFEMPPHAQMSLAQALLIRALVARFWNKPYKAALQHWGTSLHDRFMLPFFVWDDFCDVLAELSEDGVRLEPEWFAPHFEFRFPKIGSLCHRGVELELRTALEPWHVTGEHGVSGGTARYVDSSLERIQVLVRGLPEARYQLACNGTRIPLRPTGTVGEFVAGVRYRAWQPPLCLHPTIGVDTPLVLDLYDTWSGRSVAGCSYHVAHPAGRNYELFPVNALEAEGRRLARFSTDQHSGGAMTLKELPPNRLMPCTLDMRLTHGGAA